MKQFGNTLDGILVDTGAACDSRAEAEQFQAYFAFVEHDESIDAAHAAVCHFKNI